MRARAFLLIAVAALVSACTDGDWKGTAWPDSFDRSQPEDLGFFHTFEACQKAAKKRASELAESGSGSDYECGFKCEFDLDSKSTTCQEKRK